MVGVPSSRACAPCRKAKKKCLDSESPCSRCVRLELDCTELGWRPLVFKDEGNRFFIKSSGSSASPASSSGTPETHSQHMYISRPISNDFSRSLSTFVHGVDTAIDIRMQLPWNFGPFLEDVPQHLGYNEALDAAAECLMSAYSHFRNTGAASDKTILKQYCYALQQLQYCLSVPEKAHATETLCATMLLMIFETLSGTSDTAWISHSGGAATILKSRVDRGPKNELEEKLILTLRGPVILQSMFKPTTIFTPEEWASLTTSETDLEVCSIDEQMLRHLSQLPDMMRSARKVLASREPLSLAVLQHKAVQLRKTLSPINRACVDRYRELDTVLVSCGDHPDPKLLILHAHFARTALMSMATHILTNCLAEGLLQQSPCTYNSTVIVGLQDEAAALSREILSIAKQVDRHRPLGTVYMNFVLRVAWVGAGTTTPSDDILQLDTLEQKRLEVECMLIDFGSDLHGIQVATSGVKRPHLEWLAKYLRLESVTTQQLPPAFQ